MKPALLIIDVQKDFFHYGAITTKSLQDAIKTINKVSAFFREKKLPVICIQHIDPEDGLLPGTEGFDLPDELVVLPGDIRINKTYQNAFNRTPLLEEIRRLNVDTVIITGYCAEFCVLSTCRGAKDVDLTPILLRDSLASDKPERIRFVEEINEVISLRALKKMIS